MQSLQQKASEYSGVDQNDAFAIDEINLFEKLGLQTFIDLSTNFYNRVYEDEEEWFRSIFANSKKEDAIQNQYEFFVQRMGGPPLYSQRRETKSMKRKGGMRPWKKLLIPVCSNDLYSWNSCGVSAGHPALIARHRPFPVTHRAAERWLLHMQQALDSVTAIDADSKTKMMNFFRHTAFFLVAGDELKAQNQHVPCKHATKKNAPV